MKPRLQALLLFLMAIAHTAVADEIMQPRTAIQNAPDACVCTMSQTQQLMMANCSCGSKQCVVSLTSYTTSQPSMQCFDAPKSAALEATAEKSK
ncbi:hypothetical protein JJD66_16630 [Pseudomonas sp. MF6751]|jgi:hypothetical protein|uniref:hypothetical protein n=1 Tax=unclassified Pseudomonas TaxID=196821 RepID=UPI000D03B272|nr:MULTISPECIES: hypothetical protein [unclassified Pseudomonas]MBK3477715.1 hypothetical protein [Pseudomonas sp. MF6751]MBO0495696.1 hypothetical protein [Pseudomonas sp. Marseille-Q1929]PRW97100.1 hypothetical protein C7A07_17860 [Pseudomonas fragi]